ncbi:MAG: ABC transporter ATP-binding protein [Spartobacteria bacterium]|nr:ABC transporter ATP-binding protein [Spartobacteria bacterium]
MNAGGGEEKKMVLRMRDVTRSFDTPHGPVHVLKDVQFVMDADGFVIVTGPSGSGKTTFLNLASLLDVPSAGQVFFDSRDVSKLPEAALCDIRKHHIGMVFQNFYLLPHRSALDNVAFRFRYLDVDVEDARRQAMEALTMVGLRSVALQPARVLSGGEMQRVAIARAVAQRPRMLVADEPTGNLDRASARVVMDCFVQLNEAGIGVLLVTHDESLLAYGTRHVICRDGRLIEGAL